MKAIFAIILTIGLVGCATRMSQKGWDAHFKSEAKKRAAHDFGCDEKEVSISQINTKTFGAKGCSKKATYIVHGRCLPGGNESMIKQGCTVVNNTMTK